MIDTTLDFHAHILPGCDHGSDRVETSLRQIAMARRAGVKTICATPHFYPQKENVRQFLERRAETYAALCAARTDEDPVVKLGAEVLICDGLDRMDGLKRLCLQDTDTLLLEMPFYAWPGFVWDTLYRLHDLPELRLVIAHAERYAPEDVEILIRDGMTLQLNAGCLTRPLRRRRYLDWIARGAVQYLGSDIHMLGPGYREWKKSASLLADRGLRGQEGNA